MSLADAAERLVWPLDWGRRLGLSWILRNKLVLSAWGHRDRRISTLATINIGLAAFGAVYFPVLLFTLGPVLLGVAHVASDVRYLILRRSLARWWRNVIWLGCLALISVRVLEELQVIRGAERYELCIAVALVAVALAAALRENGSGWRASIALALLTCASGLAWQHPSGARLVFLHLHNLVALGAWGLLFRVQKRWLVGPVSLIVVAAVLLISGAFYRATLSSPFVSAFQLHVLAVASWVAPFADIRVAVGVTSAYVFLQSVHYSVWLSWVPQKEQPGRGTPTYRMSVRSLFADLGPAGVLTLALAAAAVLLGACFELHRTRALYLSLATFHGYVELALVAFFWVRLGARGEAPSPRQWWARSGSPRVVT